LLHGVTSSGKTHLYLDKIEETISKGKNVFFCLPEIAITKQITQRLEKNTEKHSVFTIKKCQILKKLRFGER
jgi:primosomal protein N' (replication factor Y)